MKKVIFILFALVLFSCRQSSNQSAPETSTSDSVELKKQEVEPQLLCLQLEKLPMSAEHALEKVSF